MGLLRRIQCASYANQKFYNMKFSKEIEFSGMTNTQTHTRTHAYRTVDDRLDTQPLLRMYAENVVHICECMMYKILFNIQLHMMMILRLVSNGIAHAQNKKKHKDAKLSNSFHLVHSIGTLSSLCNVGHNIFQQFSLWLILKYSPKPNKTHKLIIRSVRIASANSTGIRTDFFGVQISTKSKIIPSTAAVEAVLPCCRVRVYAIARLAGTLWCRAVGSCRNGKKRVVAKGDGNAYGAQS